MDDPNLYFLRWLLRAFPFIFVVIGFVVQIWFHVRASSDGCCVEITVPECNTRLVTLYLCTRGELRWFLDPKTVSLTTLFIVVGIGLQRRQGELDPVKVRTTTIGLIIGGMGIVLALSNFSNPAIGPAMAIGFLAVLYTSH